MQVHDFVRQRYLYIIKTRVELVIGVHPNDIVRLKMQTEISGMEAMIEDAELNVNYAREDKV